MSKQDLAVPPPTDRRRAWADLKRLCAYLKPHARLFYPAVVALFLTAGLSLAFPYFMGTLVGGAMQTQDQPAADINKTSLIMMACLTAQAILVFFRIRWFTKSGESALMDLRKDTFAHLVRQPMAFFGERRVGELMSRITADLDALRETLITTLPQIIRQTVTLLGGMIFIFITSTKLSLFMLACVPVVVILAGVFGRKVRSFSRRAQDALAESNIVVEESLQAITSVKSYGREPYETDRYQKALQGFLKATMHGTNSRAAFVSFIIFAMFGVITLVVWFGSGMLSRGEITAEEFSRFILFSIFVGSAMGSFPEILGQLNKTLGASERVLEILNAPIERLDETESHTNAPLKGEVSFSEVSFSYPGRPGAPVLKNVSFHVQAGQRIALVGPSGAGKSTLVTLIQRFYEPESGEIRYDGIPANQHSISSVRHSMAYVPQEILLFGGSIRENIAYGMPDATDAQIHEAAVKANAAEFIQKLPEGYETIVGDRGTKLSGGQRQRIAIARAILSNPSILILDEATSSLDAESERLVQQALDSLMEGRTCFIIAHRLSTIREADEILVLEDGQIRERGTHDALIQLGGLYQMLARLQFRD